MKKYIILLIFILFSVFSLGGNPTEYIVSAGDNLSKIARTYDITVDDLKEFNGLTSNTIYIGQSLLIPSDEDFGHKDYQDVTYLQGIDLDTRMCIRNTYYSQVGVRERTGNNDGVMVEKFLASTGLGKGYPWCAAFVHWTINQCGIYVDVEYPAWVPSYFPKDKLIMVRGEFQKRQPIFGDMIGIWYEKKNRLAHIGFYDSENDKYYFTVEGNTNQAGSREGDGVYRKKRIKRQVHSISSWIENN